METTKVQRLQQDLIECAEEALRCESQDPQRARLLYLTAAKKQQALAELSNTPLARERCIDHALVLVARAEHIAREPLASVELAENDTAEDGGTSAVFTARRPENFPKLSDVQGMLPQKALISARYLWPLEYHDLYSKFDIENRSGLLFAGPPGTGKSFLARAVANTAGATFFEIKLNEIYHKLLGESEKALHRLFESARETSRNGLAVILMDEVDGLAAEGDGESATSRVVNTLLTEIDNGARHDGHILLIGTTNHVRRLHPALLRPGRLDTPIYIGLPETGTRELMARSELGKVPVTEDFDFTRLAEQTEGFSAADLCIKLCGELKLQPVVREIMRRIAGEPPSNTLAIQNDDLSFLLKQIRPSVTKTESDSWQAWAKGNTDGNLYESVYQERSAI